jgi:PAS domain S-box-containing protein
VIDTEAQTQATPGAASIRAIWRDSLAWLLAFSGLFLVAAWAWWLTRPGEEVAFKEYTGLAGLPAGLLVALAMIRLRRADKLDVATRRMWSICAMALVTYGVGASFSLFAQSVTGWGVLQPIGLTLQILTYPIVWIALSVVPGPSRSATDLLLVNLDVTILVWAISMLAWHLWLYPIARAAGASLATTLGAALFPALDLALIGTLFATALRTPRRGTSVALAIVGVAMVVTLAGDMVAATQYLREGYQPGGVTGLLYAVAWFGIGVAMYAQWRMPQSRRQVRALTDYWRGVGILPYVAVALAFIIPVISAWDDQEMLRQHVPATGILMALVVARLAVTVRENARLGAAEREMLATAIEQTTDAVVVTNRWGAVTYVNRAFTRITGYAAEEVVGRPMSEMQGDTGGWSGEEVRAVVARGESWAGRMEGRRRDGEPFHVHMTVAPLRDQGGAHVGSVGVAKDIAREQELEIELARAQRMEAIGRLAGGVAHDFNNILTVINGFSELALTELPKDHPVVEDVAEISRASERAASLTRALLAFSRRQVMRPQAVNLNEVVAGMTPMLGVLLGGTIEVEVKAADRLGWVMADRAQLEQVILNLASNARDAMPEGGRLTITTRNVTLSEKHTRIHGGGGPYVALTVADTGVGMTPEVREHAFEPFFTTKERGKGTGLGLSTAIGVVQQSGGSIHVESKPGAGSEFTIHLPRVSKPEKPDPVEEPSADRAAVRGSETILVAEDEDPVRVFVERTLRQSGYRVLTAANGADALELARHEPHIDLLFTDMVMPGMTGRELATRLAAMRPGLPAVYASGYSDEALRDDFSQEAGLPYLAKPFSAEALLTRVREALDGRA